MGTTGEGNSVSASDGLLMVETAVKASKGRILIYAGLTGNCFAEQLRQAEAYTKAGADVIVATLPSYYALTDEQMYGYYKTLADSITGPLMLYNILATTHMTIPVEVVKRLADHPNIVGLKDSERDLERMQQCIAISRDREDFAYFCGWAAQSAYSLSIGGDGIVPSTGNYGPVPRRIGRRHDHRQPTTGRDQRDSKNLSGRAHTGTVTHRSQSDDADQRSLRAMDAHASHTSFS